MSITTRKAPRRAAGLIPAEQSLSAGINPAARPANRAHQSSPRRRWLAWIALLVLAGYALFSHGCHWGDEDTELLLRTAGPVAGLSTDG